MRKIILLGVASILMAVIVTAQPVTVWVWDNDNGARMLNPDGSGLDTINTETLLVAELQTLGYEVYLTQSFVDPASIRPDAIFIVNGWKDPENGQIPGSIPSQDRSMLTGFIDISFTPVYMEGCDVATTYGDSQSVEYDTIFLYQYFHTRLVADLGTTPVDSIHGAPGTPFEGLHFAYAPFNPPFGGPRSSVDVVDSLISYGTSSVSFFSTPEKWIYGRGVSYSDYYKSPANGGPSILNSFILAACRNNAKDPLSRRTELLRRIMRYFGTGAPASLYPAPVRNLNANEEGQSVVLRWLPASDPEVNEYLVYRSINDTLNPIPVSTVFPPLDTFADTMVSANTTYYYYIRTIAAGKDTSRRSEYAGTLYTGVTADRRVDAVETGPFLDVRVSGSCLKYRLATAGPVKFSLYDIAGRQLRGSIIPHQAAGVHSIDLNGIASGVYLSALSRGSHRTLRRFVIAH
ncbi:MAG: hypothetical protein QME74_03935 [Candidatus Edwardsbacteria bacterium]|nr:hypothetical protein [Candidatus Edwardsbacteria bacterium]